MAEACFGHFFVKIESSPITRRSASGLLYNFFMNENKPHHIAHHVRKVFKRTHDPLWHMYLGVIAVVVLQGLTSYQFLPFNKAWLIAIELLLLIAIAVFTSEGYGVLSKSRRNLVIILIAIIAAFNVISLILLIDALLFGYEGISGLSMLANGLVIYITNILMFALLYWELDGGGPDRRTSRQIKRDFLFTQMDITKYAESNWLPGYTDYLYLSTTNVTNFASADVRPISHRAKMLMMIQALVAVVTVLLVLARAINILH